MAENNNIGNNKVLYVRAFGVLVPISEVNFVQLDPNNKEIVQEIPLTDPINRLMQYVLLSCERKVDNNK